MSKIKIRKRESEGLSKSELKKITIESKTMKIPELIDLYSSFKIQTHQNRMTIMNNTMRTISSELCCEWMMTISFELMDLVTEKTELDTIIKLFICAYLDSPDKEIAHQILLDPRYHSLTPGKSIYALLTSILASFPLNDASVCDGIISELLNENEILENKKAAQDITNAICILICADPYRIVNYNYDSILDFYERLLSYGHLEYAEILTKLTAEQTKDRRKFASECEGRFRSQTNENFNREAISNDGKPFTIGVGHVLITCETERKAFIINIPRLLFNEIHVELLICFRDTIQVAADLDVNSFIVYRSKELKRSARKKRKDAIENERKKATEEKYSNFL